MWKASCQVSQRKYVRSVERPRMILSRRAVKQSPARIADGKRMEWQQSLIRRWKVTDIPMITYLHSQVIFRYNKYRLRVQSKCVLPLDKVRPTPMDLLFHICSDGIWKVQKQDQNHRFTPCHAMRQTSTTKPIISHIHFFHHTIPLTFNVPFYI